MVTHFIGSDAIGSSFFIVCYSIGSAAHRAKIVSQGASGSSSSLRQSVYPRWKFARFSRDFLQYVGGTIERKSNEMNGIITLRGGESSGLTEIR